MVILTLKLSLSLSLFAYVLVFTFTLFHNKSLIDGKVHPAKHDVETILIEFGLFTQRKTAENTANWVNACLTSKGILPKHIHSHSVDGGAMAGCRKFDELTGDGRPKEIENIHCGFHCNSLSANEGLGVSKRKNNENEEMGECLKRLHKLLSRMLIRGLFLKSYHDIQIKNNHESVNILICGDTRADGRMIECEVFNVARADITEAYLETVGENYKNAKYLEVSDDEDKLSLPVSRSSYRMMTRCK